MKKQWKWAVGIGLFCILAPITYTLFSVEEEVIARKGAARVGSDFVDALALHEYDRAYAMLTLPQQQVVSVGAIQKAEEEAEKHFGRPTHGPVIDEYAVGKNLKSVRFLFDNTYSHKTDLFLVALVYIDGRWQVSKYQYDYNPA
ncbi:MAG: hypothetical protein ACRYFS_22375 [Janthinobacterium lividum]